MIDVDYYETIMCQKMSFSDVKFCLICLLSKCILE